MNGARHETAGAEPASRAREPLVASLAALACLAVLGGCQEQIDYYSEKEGEINLRQEYRLERGYLRGAEKVEPLVKPHIYDTNILPVVGGDLYRPRKGQKRRLWPEVDETTITDFGRRRSYTVAGGDHRRKLRVGMTVGELRSAMGSPVSRTKLMMRRPPTVLWTYHEKLVLTIGPDGKPFKTDYGLPIRESLPVRKFTVVITGGRVWAWHEL